MKRYLIVFMLSFLSAGIAFSQTKPKKDPEAKKILDKAKAKFETYSSFQADFTQKMVSKKTGMNETNEGKIKIKGEKFWLKMGDQEVFVNGKKMWTVLREDCETNVSTYDKEDSPMMKPKDIAGMYKNGYDYIYFGDQTVGGEQCFTIVLSPDLPSAEKLKAQVRKITIFIGKKDYIIKRWKILERTGNEYTYMIKNFKPNVTLSDATFEYTKSVCKCCDIIKLD